MDLRKEWQKLQEEKFNQSQIKKEDIMNAIYQESHSTISTLKTRLKAKMNWTLFFMGAFVGLMIYGWDKPDFLLIMGIVFFAYLAVYIGMFFQYRQMDSNPDLSQQPIHVMKDNYDKIKKALSIEKIFGLIMLPLAIIFGMMFKALLRGDTIAELVQRPQLLLYALVAIIILVPIMIILTNKMNDYAYGKLMERLKNNIRRLEDLS